MRAVFRGNRLPGNAAKIWRSIIIERIVGARRIGSQVKRVCDSSTIAPCTQQ